MLRPFAPFLLAFCALFAGPSAAWAQDFPKLTGRVVDAANIIPDDEEARLTQKLAALEQQSRRQLVVATIPDLQGYDIEDYGYRLGRAWGIGQKGDNNGALLIVAPHERKVRIEVGYGLEPVLTDGMSFLIISHDILPRFKAGDMAGGIEAGTDAIIKQLTLPPEEAQKIAAQADQQQRDQGDDLSFGHVIFILFIIFFFILPIFRAARGGQRYGIGGPIIWMPGGFGGGDRGGGWGGGGGGFSGGGGSFGGGGSSGSW
ncbi:TPM domain-containing protein [Novosphingobium sp.]|uniref:TPM domain-containing protein n=1 Tax=Novosphingobium sp. TaxID=1874826 RepID=UPI003FA613EC